VPARRGLLSIVIDPDNARRAHIRGMLQKQVMVVCEAASLSEARHAISALGAPDLVICDITILRETIESLNDGVQPEGGYVRAYRLAVIPDRREALHALPKAPTIFWSGQIPRRPSKAGCARLSSRAPCTHGWTPSTGPAW
jgi:hypothetical protein